MTRPSARLDELSQAHGALIAFAASALLWLAAAFRQRRGAVTERRADGPTAKGSIAAFPVAR